LSVRELSPKVSHLLPSAIICYHGPLGRFRPGRFQCRRGPGVCRISRPKDARRNDNFRDHRQLTLLLPAFGTYRAISLFFCTDYDLRSLRIRLLVASQKAGEIKLMRVLKSSTVSLPLTLLGSRQPEIKIFGAKDHLIVLPVILEVAQPSNDVFV